MAWLDTMPEARKGSTAAQKSRRERLGDTDPPMPPVDAQYLLDIFLEIGPLKAGGTAGVPVEDVHLRHWQENTGIRLAPWECRTLIRMSREYFIESMKAVKANCPAPYELHDYVLMSAAEELEAEMDAMLD